MQVIANNSAGISSSDAPESLYDAWDTDANYVAGDVAWLGQRDYVFTGTDRQGESGGTNGGVGDPSTLPQFWTDIGAANRWRCVDNQPVNKTILNDFGVMDITVDISGRLDRVCLYAMDANSVTVELKPKSGGTTFYSSSHNLVYTGGRGRQRNLLIEVTERIGVRVIIALTKILDADAGFRNSLGPQIGMIMGGLAVDVGNTGSMMDRSIHDYSTTVEDEWGNETFRKRGYSKKITANVRVPIADQDQVIEYLESLRATPVLIDCNNEPGEYPGRLVFGTFKKISAPIVDWETGLTVEIKGLVE